jgi:hypothetical protein
MFTELLLAFANIDAKSQARVSGTGLAHPNWRAKVILYEDEGRLKEREAKELVGHVEEATNSSLIQIWFIRICATNYREHNRCC